VLHRRRCLTRPRCMAPPEPRTTQSNCGPDQAQVGGSASSKAHNTACQRVQPSAAGALPALSSSPLHLFFSTEPPHPPKRYLPPALNDSDKCLLCRPPLAGRAPPPAFVAAWPGWSWGQTELGLRGGLWNHPSGSNTGGIFSLVRSLYILMHQ
jgi:hypothetical protein